MKKILIAVLSLILLISSCGKKKPQYTSDVYPSELLTQENIAPYLDYAPEMTEERSRRVSVAEYKSNPVGQGYPVVVKVYQKNGLQSAEKVKEYYDECKKMRSDAFDAELNADDSFIAYPAIHYYIDGYHVEITAGGGSDDLQKALLINLATVSIDNFTALTGISANQSAQSPEESPLQADSCTDDSPENGN